jgi:hypothetical protein
VLAQRCHELRHRVAVDRADVLEAQLLEEEARDDQLLGQVLGLLRELQHPLTHLWNCEEKALDVVLQATVGLAVNDPVQVALHRPYIRGDRHLVVVEDQHQLAAEVPGLVEAFHRHPAGEPAVADDRHHPVVLAPEVARHRHAQRRGDRGRRVSGVKGVVLALLALEEARDPPVGSQRVEALAPAGDHLVRVALVPDVPHQEVAGRVEDVVQRESQLQGAQPGGQVPAGLAHRRQQETAQLLGEVRECLLRNPAQIRGARDLLQQSHVVPYRSRRAV